MKKTRNILWGIVLVTLGIIFGLNALEITDIDIFFDGWWTLFIIVPCFIDLFNDKDKTGNIIGLIIGIVLLLCSQDLFEFELVWKLMIPTILVIIGLSFIFKDAINSKVRKEINKLNKNETNEYCATFGGQKVNFDNEEFKGCTLSAVFGGVECDLRDTLIKEDTVINVCAVFGGVDIKVPKGVNIKVTSTPLFGGVTNKVKNSKEQDTKTIYINATCIFGGVDIK